MNCDNCNKRIGNTLYEVGELRLCAICWLGKKEGSKSKYQQFDNSWTIAKLKAHKDKMKKL